MLGLSEDLASRHRQPGPQSGDADDEHDIDGQQPAEDARAAGAENEESREPTLDLSQPAAVLSERAVARAAARAEARDQRRFVVDDDAPISEHPSDDDMVFPEVPAKTVHASKKTSTLASVDSKAVRVAEEGPDELDLLLRNQQNIDIVFDPKELLKGQQADPYCVNIRLILQHGMNKDLLEMFPPMMKHDLKKRRFRIDEYTDCIMYRHPKHHKDLFLLPPAFRQAWLKHYHENIFTGQHSPVKLMQEEVVKEWYWPGYANDIKYFVESCHLCQLQRAVLRRNIGKMRLFAPKEPGEHVAVDHKGPIYPATADGNLYITSFIDLFSGMVWSYPAKSIGAFATARRLLQHTTREGVPYKLTSDQGSDFTSAVCDAFRELSGVLDLKATLYYPEGNGAIERYHRTMTSGFKIIQAHNNIDFQAEASWEPYVD